MMKERADTVMLGVAGEYRSRHSPNTMEAAKIATVVTMATSRLSRTLKHFKCLLSKAHLTSRTIYNNQLEPLVRTNQPVNH